MATVEARKVLLKDVNGQYIIPYTGAVEAVNGKKPDTQGNVEIGVVSAVNNVAPDGTGNVTVAVDKTLQAHSTANGEFSLLAMAQAGATESKIDTTVFSTGATLNPSTGTVSASKFKGPLEGNAQTASSAAKLTTPRSISLVGQVTGSGNFDGSSNLSISTSLANTGVTAGTYGEASSSTLTYGAEFDVPSVAVDSKGRITSAAAATLKMPATPVTSVNGKTGALTPADTGCLPTAGGTMSGPIVTSGDRVRAPSNANYIRFNGGTAYEQGSSLLLTGQDFEGHNGMFALKAFDGSTGYTLSGTASGALTWGGVKVTLRGECIPVGGGNVDGVLVATTGNAFRRNIDNSYLAIMGATSSDKGSYMQLYGYTEGGPNGAFSLFASNGTDRPALIGYPNGSLYWANKSVERVNSSGTGYIRYENGLQICWGSAGLTGGANTVVTLPVAFADTKYSMYVTRNSGETATTAVNVWLRDPQTTTTFNIYADLTTGCRWLAVGRWK